MAIVWISWTRYRICFSSRARWKVHATAKATRCYSKGRCLCADQKRSPIPCTSHFLRLFKGARLPICTSCPELVCRIIEQCWTILPDDRPPLSRVLNHLIGYYIEHCMVAYLIHTQIEFHIIFQMEKISIYYERQSPLLQVCIRRC